MTLTDYEIEWADDDGQQYIIFVTFEDHGEGPECNAELVNGNYDFEAMKGEPSFDYWGMSEGGDPEAALRALRETLSQCDPQLLEQVGERLDQEIDAAGRMYREWVEDSMRQAGLLRGQP